MLRRDAPRRLRRSPRPRRHDGRRAARRVGAQHRGRAAPPADHPRRALQLRAVARRAARGRRSAAPEDAHEELHHGRHRRDRRRGRSRRCAICAAPGVDVVTLGQYLRPTPKHAPVDRFVEPERVRRVRARRARPWASRSSLGAARAQLVQGGRGLRAERSWRRAIPPRPKRCCASGWRRRRRGARARSPAREAAVLLPAQALVRRVVMTFDTVVGGRRPGARRRGGRTSGVSPACTFATRAPEGATWTPRSVTPAGTVVSPRRSGTSNPSDWVTTPRRCVGPSWPARAG